MSKKGGAPAASGQKTLFSFFCKKPSTPSSDKTNTTTGKNESFKNKNAENEAKKPEWHDIKVGTRLSVYWPEDKKSYNATVLAHAQGCVTAKLQYDDDETETLDLSKHSFQILTNNEQAPPPRKKRRRIEEDESLPNDDDDEMEFDIAEESEHEDDDDGSVYQQDAQQEEEEEEDDDDDDHWMVTDDEDDQEIIQDDSTKKNKKKRLSRGLKVTQHSSKSTGTKTPPKPSTTTLFQTPSNQKPNMFDSYKSGGSKTSSISSSSTKVTPATRSADRSKRKVTPDPVSTPLLSDKRPNNGGGTATTATSSPPPPFQYGVVNMAGSHCHNHLKFLQHPRDAQGRTPQDACYDAKTLKVDYNELNRIQAKSNASSSSKTTAAKLSPASRQWWEIKSQYFDTVLLFKTGKFYEMFHMDADIGVQILGHAYMKGHVAHSGFPEIGYGKFAEQLVKAGYKVARVEQTETPEALKERNKSKRRGADKAKVVNREVCSILTSGTRTFCYMDDIEGLEETGIHNNNNNNGPLLAIREVLLKENGAPGDDGDEQVRAVCEYGVTVVDAVRGTVTLGQFADDVLRSRMNTLLTTFSPSEILVEGGETEASPVLLSLLKAFQKSSGTLRVERIQQTESFPKSTAVEEEVRRKMERPNPRVHPWNVQETLKEIHRRKYYPRGSRENLESTSRWPNVLQVAIEGNAELALSSFGAAIFYLQRNLIDQDVLGMGIVKAYIPPTSVNGDPTRGQQLMQAARQEQRAENGFSNDSQATRESNLVHGANHDFVGGGSSVNEDDIDHLALDGTTLENLEILFNSHSHTVPGSLWSKINHTKSPHGSRLLRAWLLRPLFRKADITRRADAVEELVSGAAAMSMSEARHVLANCGDIERLLSRVHSMGAGASNGDEQQHHPNERAILYEMAEHTKRKVADFSKVLNGLRNASKIPELFDGVEIASPLLRKIVTSIDNDGCFPNMTQKLDWFFDHFDCEQASQGLFEPSRGTDDSYDEACDAIIRIKRELEDYKVEMCSQVLRPSQLAKSSWKYANTKDNSKDKYLIELPARIQVPDDFLFKAKRGKGDKQINKYYTPVVEELVADLERAIEVQKEGKERGMQLVFAKFDSMRNLWAAAARATAMLDALGSLAQVATSAGYTRPKILDCPPDSSPCIQVQQGRHPCVDHTHNGGEFVPNDLMLGEQSQAEEQGTSRILLLSGPNMGGKSTLLRQTCLIVILAQVGCYVPAEECSITPIDRIFTRLGATDRILLGQSTFFVELAEIAAALRGATRRSLVCADELGRGTSTFDGTAIASATVKHLVQRSQCLSLFATHYHSLLEDWKSDPFVRLGHMECLVESADDEGNAESPESITFMYTLGEGVCPKSFGINVARLAVLPEEVLTKAKRVSAEFEAEMNGSTPRARVTPSLALALGPKVRQAFENNDASEIERLWETLQ